MKTLEQQIRSLSRYVNDRDKREKFTNKDNDDEYVWNHCGVSAYYHGKLSALRTLKGELDEWIKNVE